MSDCGAPVKPAFKRVPLGARAVAAHYRTRDEALISVVESREAQQHRRRQDNGYVVPSSLYLRPAVFRRNTPFFDTRDLRRHPLYQTLFMESFDLV
jgi:hypothetical protein